MIWKAEGGKGIDINRDNINKIYNHIIDVDARIVVCYGGRDSGKSYFVGGQYIPALLCADEYFRGVAVRKVYATHRDSCYQEVVDGLDTLEQQHEEAEYKRLVKNADARAYNKAEKLRDEGKEYNIKKLKEVERRNIDVSQMSDSIKTIKSPLEIDNKSNGNKLIFRGMDRPKKLKSLKGLNFIWVEEAEDLTREEFYELLMLLRGGDPETQKLVLTFNPIDEGHFTNGMFVESVADEIIETFDNGDKKVWIKYLEVEVGSLNKGDLMTIAGNTYVVTEDTLDASGNAIAGVKFYPAAPEAGIADNAAITFVTADSVRNMGFHKNAFAFVTRALPLPSDAQGYVVSFNGITLRVVRSYDISTKKEIMSMDVLYGFKTVYPELAQVRLG